MNAALVAGAVPALPFLAALAGLLSGRRLPGAVRPLAILPTALATVLAVVVLAAHGTGGVVQSLHRYTPTGSLEIWLGMRVDGLAALVAVMVCIVAVLVQIYSSAYLRDDPRYSSYAALVSLFTAAMLLVVYSADLIVLLVGWEVMGICSYFLIGHYWEQPEARSASIKAFLMTKLGDVPFLLGIFVLGLDAGSFRIDAVFAALADGRVENASLAAFLLLGGVIGKSAQFPLHSWLPDAMAGPTPISALIHAATMVAAGVYVVARLYPVFLADGAPALGVLAVIATITMIGSALAAFAQDDIKRVLAYSTVSQLAYMAGGLAVGGRDAAMFHLLAHAGYKALLFLAAGVVIHAVGTNSMSRMGGLRHTMPVTFATTTLGLAALAGLPPLSGFFSKDAVLAAAEATALHHPEGSPSPFAAWIVLVAGLLTVVLTGAYVARLWLRTFFGASKAIAVEEPAVAAAAEGAAGHAVSAGSEAAAAVEAELSRGHAGAAADPGQDPGHGAREAPVPMLWPLVALAVPTVLLGFLGLSSSWLPTWFGDADGGPYTAAAAEAGRLAQDAHYYHLAPTPVTGVLSMLLALAGVGAVYLVWRRDTAADPARVLGRARGAVENAFGIDELYDAVVVRPVYGLARVVRFTDTEVVDGYVRGAGIGARLSGGLLRRVQNGNVQVYLTGLLAGVVVIAVTVAASAAGGP